MKKLIAISATALVMAASGIPSAGELKASAVATETSITTPGLLQLLITQDEQQTMLEQQAAAAEAELKAQEAKKAELLATSKQLNTVIEKLTNRVGKTRYVFSGSTPQGWDCSGLVMWAYGELGVELEHRASKQQNAGEAVDEPKLGDIVVFKYNGRESAYHVGIYLYPDTMIHAGGGKGDTTEIVSISKFAGKHSQITYRRLVETS